ncbi:MAG: patatin-like phospholipase family protein [Desulfobacterota bacterium]|nr:patatin-like phospholipase family protein [Thermodesulfobacteriota bacterium]
MKYLSIYAGPKAREIIAEHGLTPDMVEVVAGAAGGPKWLALYGLDKAMFTSWLMERTSPVFLLGSSVGTWRFAALAQGMEAHERFRDAYLRQRFTVVPTAAQASAEIMKFLDAALDGDGPSRILTHPYARLTFLAVRCSGPYGVDRKYPLLLLMAAAGILNTASRGLLRLFFSRVLFHDPRDLPPYHALKGFPLQSVPLTVENVRPAVMASGSMPVIMTGVRDIPGAGPGMYRDAGILDYHLAIPFASSRIVLFPHYTNRITPGWFDKMLPWRRPSRQDAPLEETLHAGHGKRGPALPVAGLRGVDARRENPLPGRFPGILAEGRRADRILEAGPEGRRSARRRVPGGGGDGLHQRTPQAPRAPRPVALKPDLQKAGSGSIFTIRRGMNLTAAPAASSGSASREGLQRYPALCPAMAHPAGRRLFHP